MPLIKKPTKKAFEHNVEAEMHAGKPQDQSLAIAYSIKKKNKKKMANGGLVNFKDEVEADADNASTPEEMRMRKESSGKDIKHPQFNSEGHADADNARDDEEMEMKRKSRGEMSHDVDITVPEEHEADADNQRRKPMAKGGYLTNAKSEGHADIDNAKTDEDEDMMEHFDDGGIAGSLMKLAPMALMALSKGGSIADRIMQKRKMMAEGGEVDLAKNSEEDLNNEDQMSFDAGLKEQYDVDQISPQPMDSNEKGDSRESDAENMHDDDMIEQIRKRLKAKRGE